MPVTGALEGTESRGRTSFYFEAFVACAYEGDNRSLEVKCFVKSLEKLGCTRGRDQRTGEVYAQVRTRLVREVLRGNWRPEPDSNRRMTVLQTVALANLAIGPHRGDVESSRIETGC